MDITVDNVFPDGPSSNPTNPSKALIRSYFRQFETAVDAGLSNGGLIYDTKANMDADLAHAANASAWVIADSTVANNGIYRKSGASGTGSWTRIGDLPYSFIRASNAGAGTANAIQATTSIPIPAGDGAAEIVLNITENNTGAATVSFNGGAALSIVDAAGSAMKPGDLAAGMVVTGTIVGTNFRLNNIFDVQFVSATNTGAGSANAIQASTVRPLPTSTGSALVILPIVATNTSSPVTVSFNGASPMTIKTVGGSDVPAGALAAGNVVAGLVSGSIFRLLTEALSLPSPEATKVLGWNALGTALENKAASGLGDVLADNQGYDIPLEAVFAGAATVVRNVGEKLNLDLPSSADLGHSPEATASYNDGALQAAIDAMLDEPGGGMLTIPRGTFEHSSQQNCPKTSGKHVLLQGHGRGTKLHFTPSEAMNAFYVGSDSVAGGEAGFKMLDLELTADTSTYAVNGVYLQNANSFHAERVNMNGLTDGFIADTTYGLRLIANRMLSMGGDFFRAANRSHGNVFRDNGYYSSDGYFLNFQDALSNVNNYATGNDLEVLAGIVKTAGPLYAFMLEGNYMEQSTVKVFDFGDPNDLNVVGMILGNELSLSPTQALDNFHGKFDGNHLYNFSLTKGSNAYVDWGRGNIPGGTGSLPLPAIGTGSWTPVLEGSTIAGAGTYSTQSGTIMYSNGWAFITGLIVCTAHTGTGNIVISGLPFANTANTNPIVIRVSNMTYSNDLVCAVNAGATTITVQSQSSGAALAQVPIDGSCTISFTGMYRIE